LGLKGNLHIEDVGDHHQLVGTGAADEIVEAAAHGIVKWTRILGPGA
jgi:hypothetical protein